jgi:thiosulfate/3-mercaptopyruvate sulfurtransferase
MKPLISATDLLSVQHNADLVLIDASFVPVSAAHTPREILLDARHVRLNEDLSEVPEDASRGGRHPLPALATFGRTLTRLGIHPDSYVVVYDDKNGANAAARLWWMLHAVGHTRIQVLDGGFQAAIAAGFPTAQINSATNAIPEANSQSVPHTTPSSEPSHPAEDATATYPVPAQWLLPLADIQDVADAAGDPSRLVIDVRESGRYRGEFEPLDLVAGHIPGAINHPFSENLSETGTFKSVDHLVQLYPSADNNCIIHCGSGVTACHTILAMTQAGLPMPRLYVGSWSEWSRSGRPQATGATP